MEDYNCRDYISPNPPASSAVRDIRHQHLQRHESYHELEHRSRSPASFKPKFPLLKLPLELRQEIFSYLLPRTRELVDTNALAHHALTFSAVQKRGAKGLILPVSSGTGNTTSNVVWLRGNITLFSVCKQLHEECADLVYGGSTFMLFVTYSGIKFRFRWLLPSGLAPIGMRQFLELLPERNLRRIKKVLISIDHVDAYTGMIKFNVSGKGLTHGLKRQVQILVNALKLSQNEGSITGTLETPQRLLSKVVIRVDAIKPQRSSESGNTVAEEVESILEPFRQLYGVRGVSVSGAVADEFARRLEADMRSSEPPVVKAGNVIDVADEGLGAPVKGVCVYGNDI